MTALALLLLACASKPTPAPEPAAEPPSEAPAPPAQPEPEPALRCGGIAGLRCPLPLVCIDDPDDSCLPGRGADCIGRCVPANEAPAIPGRRRPVSTDPEKCKVLRFACEEGEAPYSDASGCGCDTAGQQPL